MADLRILEGNPTDDEIAAVVVALTPVATTGEVTVKTRTTLPAWARAALLEATGGARVHAPDELAAPGR